MAIAAAIGISAATADAQRPRFPSGSSTPVSPGGGATTGPSHGGPQTTLAPVGPPPPAGPGAPAGVGAAGSTLFDPYATGGARGATSAPPSLAPGASTGYSGGGLFGGLLSAPAGTSGGFGGASAPPSFAPPPPGTAAPPPAYPSTIYPSESPSSLFPGGLLPSGGFGGGGNFSAHRLLHGPRLRHGYVADSGDGADDLAINNTDVSVAFAFPRFLYSTQPLYVVPSFGLHLWDGPRSTGGPGSADLPSAAYDGFLDFGWQSDPNRIFGLELGTRVGAFTDFDTFNSESIRVMGKGLVSFRLTPAATLKGGAYYLDRNKVKLLPAGGLLWQPNPMTRFDIFFPEPKFAKYWRTLGTHDVWWYLAGDYGGGSWTIERADGSEDSVDLNDLRVLFGLEWGRSDLLRTGRRTGFIEAGYVFAREVEYRRNPEDDFDPDDAFLIRAGIGY